ncbi:hypothetical protein [Streptomyces sp. MBT33]|uniref:hypothetical protein n=1 Tax=Streptomyces sp. MBT33 TaxID=1488363 RepID=UPI00190C66E7|nr:hypothetical protein [Streptomyces sp. MBT33]MBK3647327.1 hypothetical protein [Streptomyces sp. MBT33]
MKKVAGQDADDGHAWVERLGWAYGLTAPEAVDRAAALVRLDDARATVRRTRVHLNETRRLTSGLGHEEQDREPVLLAAREAHEEALSRCLPEALWDRPVFGSIGTWPGLPFALLFLEWEARYPQEWTQHAKAWGTKEGLIRQLAADDHSDEVRATLLDLVDHVVRRAYRCKDREYVRVARAVDGDDLRDRLDKSRRSDNPWAQLHAGYVLWLLDRPGTPNTRRVWRTWLADGTTKPPAG